MRASRVVLGGEHTRERVTLLLPRCRSEDGARKREHVVSCTISHTCSHSFYTARLSNHAQAAVSSFIPSMSGHRLAGGGITRRRIGSGILRSHLVLLVCGRTPFSQSAPLRRCVGLMLCVPDLCTCHSGHPIEPAVSICYHAVTTLESSIGSR